MDNGKFFHPIILLEEYFIASSGLDSLTQFYGSIVVAKARKMDDDDGSVNRKKKKNAFNCNKFPR